MTSDDGSPLAYRLRVSLEGVEPEILRRIEVAAQTSLRNLHAVLQAAMGWEGTHEFSFVGADAPYGHPDELFPTDRDAATVTLAQIAPKVGARFIYIYDWGDEWRHHVLVEAVEPANTNRTYPNLVEARRACPPEDSGGAASYVDLLAARRDSAHEEYELAVTTLPPTFDPDKFDVKSARLRLEGMALAGIGSFILDD